MSLRRRGAAVGALLASATLVLAACTADRAGDGPSEQPLTGSVRIFGSQPQNPLIPVMTNETGGGNVLDALFTRLVRYNSETAAPEMAVAESITPSNGNTLWTVRIQDGWTFHDGTPVTAASFVAAWNDGANCTTGAVNQFFFGPLGANIKGYEQVAGVTNADGTRTCTGVGPADTLSGLTVVDDRTFTAELAAPSSIFVSIVGATAFSPMPEAYFADRQAFAAKPIGNGPFQFVSATPNQSIALTAYPAYRGEDRAQVKDVTFTIYRTPDAAYVDLLANNLDILDRMPASALAGDAWKSELGERHLLAPYGAFQSLAFPLYREEFQSADLRTAISMAIDRQAVSDVAFNGTREPATSWTSPVVEGYQPGVCGAACTYNPAVAKALLTKAGGFDGTLTIAYNADGGHKEWVDATCVSIRSALGIDCRGKAYDSFDQLRRDVADRKMTGLFRSGWEMDFPSMQNFLAPSFGTGAGSNDSTYSNAAFDQLIREATTLDPAAAIEKYQAAERLLAADIPAIPLWNSTVTAGWSQHVNAPEFTEFGRVDLSSITMAY